jgi:hypothetical protein
VASPAAGDNPYAAAVGDFNLDGKPDLAVANQSSGSVTILLGNGDGTFTPVATSPSAGSSPVSISVADLNRDGRPDLVVANGYGDTITILPGNGDGTFGAASNESVGPVPDFVAVGDFNGDGAQDLAVANNYGNSVSVFTSQVTEVATARATGIAPAGSGTHNVEASYPGDAVYQSSVSGTTGLTAEIVTPTVTVTLSSAAISTAQDLTATVMVSGGSGNPRPTGSITLTSGSYTSTAAPLNGGSAVVNIPAGSLAAGTDMLTVSYTPDSSSSSIYQSATGSNSVTVTATPGKVTPKVLVSPSASSITTAQGLTVTVTVSGGSGNGTATGSVTLTSGSYSSQQKLAAGSTTFSLAAGTLPVGNNSLNATYTPDTAAASAYTSATQSAGVTVTQAIGTAAATVTAKASSAVITDLDTVQVTVSVSGAGGQATPTGNVSLSSGGYSAQQPLSNGTASFTIAAGSLGSGADTLTAMYAGDASYAAASGTTNVTVSALVMSLSPLSAISAGSSGTGSVSLRAGSTYSGTMGLACSLIASPAGAQSLPTCSLNPVSLNLAAGGSGTAVLTVNTTSSASARLNFWHIGGGGSVLAALLMIGIPSRRRRWASAVMMLLVVAAAGFIGCGGGGGGVNPQSTQTNSPVTTTGSYTFAVTATDSANSKVTTSTNVSVTVQ